MFKKILLASILTCIHIWLASAFEASYYSDAFEGGTSSNGTIFSQANHTAAICYEELSQLAYVSTAQTGMVVTLTDRPNCNRHTDRIDLSSSVFSTFVPLSRWLITDISATPLGIKTGKFIKRNLSQEEFLSLSVSLSKNIPNIYTRSELVSLKGRVTNNEKYVMTYLEHKTSGKKYSKSYPVGSNGSFSLVLPIPEEVWEYYFVVAGGTSFRTETPTSILVIDPVDVPVSPLSGTTLSRLSLKQTTITDTPVIALGEWLYGELSLVQGKKKYTTAWQVLWFSGILFNRGQASYTFTGYTLSTTSSLDRSPTPKYRTSWSVLLDREFDSTWAEKVRVTKQTRSMTFRFRLPNAKKVIDTYYVTLPSGDVRKYEFPSKYRDGSGYLKTGIQIQATFPTPDIGTYKLETVEHDGFAYFNIPLTRGDVWNIFPVLTESEIRTVTTSQKVVRDTTFSSINTLRSSLGRTLLVRDATLDTLAQKKAESMAQWQYVWHITPDGLGIRAFAESIGINISSSLGENVAWWNVSWLALQDGLEESWSHRANMIDPNWTKVWVWYVVSWGRTYMVHVFSN